MLRSKAAFAFLAAAVSLTGCTGTSAERSGARSPTGPPSYEHYVALGDSFTAGPYVPTTDLADGCLRSDGNYPSLVAERLEITDLRDVSCSAAEIGDLPRSQRTFRDTAVPPQLDALTRRTDLVTVSVGGNDFNLFGKLLQTCATLRVLDPQGSPCTEQLARDGVDMVEQTRRIGARLEKVVREVQRRSPDARVLLVGYPRIGPATGTCPRLLPLATGDYATAAGVARSLRSAMQEAAARVGVEFVDMYAASRGHDVCSENPWVNGRFTKQQAALAFHPFASGMRAAADLIVNQLDESVPLP